MSEKGTQRSFEARLFANLDQTRSELEAVRGAVKSLQIMLVYVIGLAIVLYMSLRKGGVLS